MTLKGKTNHSLENDLRDIDLRPNTNNKIPGKVNKRPIINENLACGPSVMERGWQLTQGTCVVGSFTGNS